MESLVLLKAELAGCWVFIGPCPVRMSCCARGENSLGDVVDRQFDCAYARCGEEARWGGRCV